MTDSAEAPRSRLGLWLVLAIAAGVATGLVLGPGAAILSEVGTVVVRLLKALATPLVFFAIVDSLVKATLPARQGVRLLGVCAVNTAVAATIALSLSALLEPGAGVELPVPPAAPAPPRAATLSATAVLKELVPESIGGPFVANQVLAVVLLGVVSGAALRQLDRRGHGAVLTSLVGDIFAVLTVMLGWVVKLVPLAIFGVVAGVVGSSGFGLFRALAELVGTVVLGLTLQVFVWYPVLLALTRRMSPRRFFSAATPALVTALSVASSLATLPVTLRTLEERMGVSRTSARLAAIIGTNFNNDGIMLYEVVAALFVAQVAGITLTPVQTAALAGTAALAAAGIAGVPEAGLITLSLVLGAADLPLSSLPLLLSVDWLLGRLRAATNVAADMTVATVLDRWDRPGT